MLFLLQLSSVELNQCSVIPDDEVLTYLWHEPMILVDRIYLRAWLVGFQLFKFNLEVVFGVQLWSSLNLEHPSLLNPFFFGGAETVSFGLVPASGQVGLERELCQFIF